MIRIQYVDSICNKQLYCSLQLQREMDEGEYTSLHIVRWFGSAEILPSPGRGELLALAATTIEYRHEVLLISPELKSEPERVLSEWRSRFQRIEYCSPDACINNLLINECHTLSGMDERAVVNEIMVKNLLPSVFYESDNDKIEVQLRGTLEDIDVGLFVFALVEPPARVVGFRKAFSKEHLKDIILQANDHSLLVYYSPFTTEGKRIVATGPWVLLPASMRSITKSSMTPIDVSQAVDTDIPPQFLDDVSSVAEETENVDSVTDQNLNDQQCDNEIVKSPEHGFKCPYCDKTMKKPYGLTNHVNKIHPDKLHEYNASK